MQRVYWGHFSEGEVFREVWSGLGKPKGGTAGVGNSGKLFPPLSQEGGAPELARWGP